MCCGLPIVASDVGGISEAVNDTNGILVEANNIKNLQDAIISIMNNQMKFDHEKISADAIAKYNYQHIAKQFISTYNEVLTT